MKQADSCKDLKKKRKRKKDQQIKHNFFFFLAKQQKLKSNQSIASLFRNIEWYLCKQNLNSPTKSKQLSMYFTYLQTTF